MRTGKSTAVLCSVFLLICAIPIHAEPTGTIGAAEPVFRLKGHKDSIIALDWSNDGKWIVSASADKTVRIWDASTGKLKHKLDGWTKMITGLQFSGDSSRLVVGSLDGTARVFDVVSGKMISRTLCGTEIYAVALSHDGRTGALGSGTNIGVALFDVAKESQIGGPEEIFAATTMKFSRDGNLLAIATIDMQSVRALKIFDTAGKTLRSFKADDLEGLSFSDDGKFLYFTNGEGVSRLNVADGTIEKIVPWRGILQWGRYFTNDHAYCVASSFSDLRISPVADPKLPERRIGTTAHFIRTVAISPDGKRVAAGVGNPSGGKSINDDAHYGAGLDPDKVEIIVYDTGPSADAPVVYPADVSVDTSMAVLPWKTMGQITNDKTCQRVDLATGKVIASLGQRDRDLSPTYSFDGKTELVRIGGEFALSDAATGKVITKLKITSYSRSIAVFSADGKSVCLAASLKEKEPRKAKPQPPEARASLHLIDLETGTVVRSFDTQGTGVRSLAIDHQLARLVAVTDRRDGTSEPVPASLRVYDLKTGGAIGQVPLGERDLMHGCRGLVITPDHIAHAGGIGAIQRFDLTEGKPLPHIELADGIYSQLALSADKKQLLALRSNAVTLVDLATSLPVFTWRFPYEGFQHIGFVENKPFFVRTVDGKGWEFRMLEQRADTK